MLIKLECIGAAQEHHAGEHIPLHFEPGIGARTEEITARGIAGADETGEQHKPIGNFAEPVIHKIDGTAELEQCRHCVLPGPRPHSDCWSSAPRSIEIAAQPPVTLMWRASAGR